MGPFQVSHFSLFSSFKTVGKKIKFADYLIHITDLWCQMGPLCQRTFTYFIRGSISVWLTSCLTALNSTKLVNLYLIQRKQSSWIQTGGQLYSDTSLSK